MPVSAMFNLSGKYWLLACLISCVAGCASVAAEKQEPKIIVILGDSIAAGYGVQPAEAFPSLLQQKIDARQLPYKVVNAGVSGDTTASGVRRMPWLLKRPMDVLVVELGGNDGLRGISPDETRSNLEKIMDLAREKNPTVQILLAGMQMPQNMGADYTRKFKEVFSEVAEKKNAKLIPFLLEGVGGRADMNQPDRIHPNPAGHKIVAENVWAGLAAILEK
ncbi:MAG: arylesterase [Verrucomicrobia bacterium]|nr:arylesterase [Verrucomicrobiota bacterium]